MQEKEAQPANAEGKPEATVEDPQQQEMRQLKMEVDSLWEDLKAALKTKTAQQEEEAGVRKQIDTLIGERDSLRKERVSRLPGLSHAISCQADLASFHHFREKQSAKCERD